MFVPVISSVNIRFFDGKREGGMNHLEGRYRWNENIKIEFK
jgi:hypothetical protein